MSNSNDFSTPEKALISVIVAVIGYFGGKIFSDKEHKSNYEKQDKAAKGMRERLEEVKRGEFSNVELYKLTRDIDLYNSDFGKDPLIEKGETVFVISCDVDFYKVVRIKTGETGYLNRKFCEGWVKINTVQDINKNEDKKLGGENITVLTSNVYLYNSSLGKDPLMSIGELIEVIAYNKNFCKVKRLKTGEVGYLDKKFVD